MTLDHATARAYLRVLVIRHAVVVAGLIGFVLLVTDASDGVRQAGGLLLVFGVVGFALSVSVLVLPLAFRVVPDDRSLTNVLAALNQLTGHSLVDEASALVGTGLVTRARLRAAVFVEIVLFASVPLVAAVSH